MSHGSTFPVNVTPNSHTNPRYGARHAKAWAWINRLQAIAVNKHKGLHDLGVMRRRSVRGTVTTLQHLRCFQESGLNPFEETFEWTLYAAFIRSLQRLLFKRTRRARCESWGTPAARQNWCTHHVYVASSKMDRKSPELRL